MRLQLQGWPRPRATLLALLAVAAAVAGTAGLVTASLGGSPAPSGPSSVLPLSTRHAKRSQPGGWTTLRDPIQASQLTELPFCTRSFWLQPWRAYLDTPLATTFTHALSANLNVASNQVSETAKLLADHGVHRVRLELPWDLMSYSDPKQLTDSAAVAITLRQLKAAGIRPLILLNANQGLPGPAKTLDLGLRLPAAAGSRSVLLTRSAAVQVVPGLTGLNTAGMAAGDIITSVNGLGLAFLSRPLPQGLGAGPHAATTLRYQPFAPPKTVSGAVNPAFAATLTGWLAYVSAITHLAAGVLGPDGFDVEVWNELSFGSDFLSAANYYSPLPASLSGTGSVANTLLAATVGWIRDPAHGVSHVGIGDGFSDQTPFAAGSTAPVGLTALDKHPYMGTRTVFGSKTGPLPCAPVDAFGRPDGVPAGTEFRDDFTPSFVDYFPEYYLTAIQTETLIRDLAPMTTYIAGVAHGARTHPPGSAPPQVWITETGIDESQVDLGAAASRHMQAKSALRFFVSLIGTGATLVDLYTAAGSNFGLIQPSFFTDHRHAASDAGGPTIDAIGRLAAAFKSSQHVTHRRSLQLLSLATRSRAVQFEGNGTAGEPSLSNLGVTAVFPFQAGNHRFVVAAYVMTRNVAEVYEPSAPANDPARYDLPGELYRIQLRGVDGRRAQAVATDPLYGRRVPVQIVGRGTDTVTLQIRLTDSPHLITLTD